ncbi:MAG TPA: hypothetical protein VD813_03160 [Pseudonocardia sp.]|nr:hypothetical protein [Pseudonocardia sp.]
MEPGPHVPNSDRAGPPVAERLRTPTPSAEPARLAGPGVGEVHCRVPRVWDTGALALVGLGIIPAAADL